MKNLTTISLITVISLLFLSSCSTSTLLKRRYEHGFYSGFSVFWKDNKIIKEVAQKEEEKKVNYESNMEKLVSENVFDTLIGLTQNETATCNAGCITETSNNARVFKLEHNIKKVNTFSHDDQLTEEPVDETPVRKRVNPYGLASFLITFLALPAMLGLLLWIWVPLYITIPVIATLIFFAIQLAIKGIIEKKKHPEKYKGMFFSIVSLIYLVLMILLQLTGK